MKGRLASTPGLVVVPKLSRRRIKSIPGWKLSHSTIALFTWNIKSFSDLVFFKYYYGFREKTENKNSKQIKNFKNYKVINVAYLSKA